jgi:hypothetical protein
VQKLLRESLKFMSNMNLPSAVRTDAVTLTADEVMNNELKSSRLASDNAVSSEQQETDGGMTWRVVIVSLLLAVLFGHCIPIVDYKMSNTFLGATHMPAAAIAVLLFLVLVVNPLLKLLSARAAFSRNETLTVYITCLFSSLVSGKGGENFFIPNILSSFYFANPQNKWLDLFLPNLKSWFTPAVDAQGVYNAAPVEGWYVGGESVPWALWIIPLAAWTSLILALYFMQACLGVMLRAQWAEREALAFPLLKFPMEITRDIDDAGPKQNRFFRNPAMWAGFAVVGFIEMLNGLQFYFPDVPGFPLSLNTRQFFTEAPWNQLGNTYVQVYPAIVGISYLLTKEVSFSLWFFHLFSKFQLIAAYTMGFQPATLEAPSWTRGWAKGFIGYQQVGAILAYVALLLWVGREHWAHIVRRAFGREKATLDEKEEALSYPFAFWGFVGGLAFILLWTVAAGVKWEIALMMWGFYLAIALALTRLVAEGGLLFVQTGWMPVGPMAFLMGAGPGKLLDTASAAPASMISSSIMLDMRGFLLPSFVQSLKLAKDRKISIKPLFALIAVTTIVSFVLSLWTVLHLGYETGGLQLAVWWARVGGSQPAVNTAGIMRGIETNIAANWGWVGIGAAMTWGMMAARSRFTWFPLHPIGLVMCVPFAMHSMWLSIFLGWLFKVVITRFGGNDGYRKATPIFLGAVLGSVVMIVFWVIVDAWQGRTGHALLPF